MITDITEKRRAEKHLAHMTDLLTRTQEVSKTGGWEYDIAAGRLVWTDEVYRIYGVDKIYDPNDITADIAAYDADSAPIMQAAFQRLVAEGEPYDLELGLIRGDGRHIWVRTIGRPVIQDGRVVRVGGNIVDITERKRAEQSLAASERRLRESFDSMLDGQAILSAVRAQDATITDFRFDYVNDVGCRLTGLPRERLIGQLLCVLRPWNRGSGLFDEYVQASGFTFLRVSSEFGLGGPEQPDLGADLGGQVRPRDRGVIGVELDRGSRSRPPLGVPVRMLSAAADRPGTSRGGCMRVDDVRG